MLIELFSLCVTAEALRANIDGKAAFFEWGGSEFRRNFQVDGGRLLPTNLTARKLDERTFYTA